jgi:hypothetical protein
VQCQSCGTEIIDSKAAFCSRCGSPLGPPEGDVTAKLDRDELHETRAATTTADDDDEGTESIPPEADRLQRAAGGTKLIGEMAVAVRRSLVAGGWGLAATAAALGFLAALAVGAAFVAVLKVYDPGFGAARDPLWVLIRIVIAGLAALGIPIEQAGVQGSVLPLGALAVIAWAIIWAGRNIVTKSGAASTQERLIQGAKIGLPFAVMVFVAALVFRVRDGIEVGAEPGAAFLLGALWGSAFGAIGGVSSGNALRSWLGRGRASSGFSVLQEGMMGAWLTLTTAAILAAAAAILFLIIDLATGSNLSLGAADAIAILFLLVVFAPNIVVGTMAFSLGAPIVFVAEALGSGLNREFSLLGWGAEGPDWFLYPLLLIPLIACLFGGYALRRRTAHASSWIEIIAIMACLFSAVLTILVYVGGISLDRAFLGEGSLLVLGADPAAVFFLSFLWAVGVGGAGWKLAETQSQPGTPTPE